MPLFQAVSPDLQQAIQREVQDELRRGRFRFAPGARGGEIADGFSWALFDAWPAWANLSSYGPANAPILFSSALAAISPLAIGIAYPLLLRE